LGPEQVDAFVERRDRLRGHYFRADAAKFFLDGEIAMHTAALLAPYADAPNARGDLLLSPEKLDVIVQRLDADGFSIHMHAMGDAAVRAGLDSIERAIAANGPKDRRHQIAHVGVADPADLSRFAKLGVTANLQPGWFQADDPAMAPAEAALGPARAHLMYPAASIVKRGGHIVMDSDWPATSLNPLEGIQMAVTRQPLDGNKPAKRPEERVTLAAAIAAYTRNAAWVAREDGIDGSIEIGKVADLVVLDRNLFRIKASTIHDAHVLLTLLNGTPVYRDPHFR
jgi:predicted amidohydrolase YtcJ